MDKPHHVWFTHSPSWYSFGWFPLLIWLLIIILLWHYSTLFLKICFYSLRYIPRSVISASYGTSICLTVLGTVNLFSIVAATFYNVICTNVLIIPHLPHHLLSSSYTSGCDVVFHYGLIYIFLTTNAFEYLFMFLLVIWKYSL